MTIEAVTRALREAIDRLSLTSVETYSHLGEARTAAEAALSAFIEAHDADLFQVEQRAREAGYREACDNRKAMAQYDHEALAIAKERAIGDLLDRLGDDPGYGRAQADGNTEDRAYKFVQWLEERAEKRGVEREREDVLHALDNPVGYVGPGSPLDLLKNGFAEHIRASRHVRSETSADPAKRERRRSFCMGWHPVTETWWLVLMIDGEPNRAFHPEHGECKAWRDTFSRWAIVPYTDEAACGKEPSDARTVVAVGLGMDVADTTWRRQTLVRENGRFHTEEAPEVCEHGRPLGLCSVALADAPEPTEFLRRIMQGKTTPEEEAALDLFGERIADPEDPSAPPDPLEKIDSLLDFILEHTQMFVVNDPHALEAVVTVLLGLRGEWASLPEDHDDRAPWRTVYGRWVAEYFHDETPIALVAAERLVGKEWREIVAFYTEWVKREREAARDWKEKSMALADLTPRDYAHLLFAFKEASKRKDTLLPKLDELLPEIRKAIGTEGDLVENLVPIFGEPIRRGFDLVRSILGEKHGEAYTNDLWARLTKKAN
jgi:hypothetical protein